MIISLSGRIGSGKDTVADILVNDYGFVREAFASTVKDAVSAIFGWDREMLEGKTPEARAERERIDSWWAIRLGIPHLSPRWVLQYYGTDVMRKHFNDDIWIAALERKLDKLREAKANVVVSDARFVNELDMLSAMGAKTVRVHRGPEPDWWSLAKAVHTDLGALAFMETTGIHRSEWDWAGYRFNTVLSNNGSLEDLALSTFHLLY